MRPNLLKDRGRARLHPCRLAVGRRPDTSQRQAAQLSTTIRRVRVGSDGRRVKLLQEQ